MTCTSIFVVLGDATSAVVEVGNVAEGRSRGLVVASDFVAKGPDEHRGVSPIALHHLTHVLNLLRHRLFRVAALSLVATVITVLIHNEDAKPVREVNPGRDRRVVRHTCQPIASTLDPNTGIIFGANTDRVTYARRCHQRNGASVLGRS